MELDMGTRCSVCGRSMAEHERSIRFQLPDPVLQNPEQELPPGTWQSHKNPNASVMMQLPGMGPFVRALLPIQLSGGGQIILGVWVSIHPDELQRAYSVWWEPEYTSLRLTGYLANAIRPWGLLGAPVELAVRNADHTPYCVGSPSHELSDVILKEWPHETLDEIS